MLFSISPFFFSRIELRDRGDKRKDTQSSERDRDRFRIKTARTSYFSRPIGNFFLFLYSLYSSYILSHAPRLRRVAARNLCALHSALSLFSENPGNGREISRKNFHTKLYYFPSISSSSTDFDNDRAISKHSPRDFFLKAAYDSHAHCWKQGDNDDISACGPSLLSLLREFRAVVDARLTFLRFQSCRLLSYYRLHCSTRERVASESTFPAPFWRTR